jgi:hypothetical protein
MQTDLFDLAEARKQRDEGIRRVAENNAEFLEAARGTARLVANSKGQVTADDVRKGCPVLPLHPNAWGAVFKGKEWEWTGQYRQSEAVSRHGGMQRIWRLTDHS